MLIQTSRHNSKRHPSLKMIALLLVAALMLTCGTLAVSTEVAASTTTQALQEAKNRQAELDAEKARLAKQNKELSNKVDKLSGDLAWLNSRSEEQKNLYAQKTLELEAAIDELKTAYDAYVAAEADVTAKKIQYTARVKTMFEHQHRSILEVFLESKSLQGFFTTLQFMEIVADTDQQMIEDLEAAKDNAAMLRDQARQNELDMQATVAQLEADIAKLKADAEATQADMQQAEVKLSTMQAAEQELNDLSASIAAEVVTLQKKVSAENAAATAAARAAAGGVSKSGWYWPYPGDTSIYSAYGMRYHPVYHYMRFHSGVDLGGSYGNPIIAARSGTVVIVRNPVQGRNTGGSGYGNYVVIDHGDGSFSLYAHMKETQVSVGQNVNASDRIGICGSTGTSTGPHLHFEIMIDGKTVNPATYIK